MRLKETGLEKVIAAYIRTPKNGQVENFYDKLEFEVTESAEDHKSYLLNLNKKEYSISDRYKVKKI
jgi:predicted enzyme involved in methoxymalonyl-ACP biosynthesis